MNMYNLLFGQNPNSEILKAMLGLGTKYHIGRFRDIYLSEDGTKILVYTRNGGGNRECYDCDKETVEDKANCKSAPDGCFWSPDMCPLKGNASMSLHPNFVEDKDDDFDCTYVYHIFTIPKEHKELVKMLSGSKEPNVTEKFQTLIKEMKTNVRKNQPETI